MLRMYHAQEQDCRNAGNAGASWESFFAAKNEGCRACAEASRLITSSRMAEGLLGVSVGDAD